MLAPFNVLSANRPISILPEHSSTSDLSWSASSLKIHFKIPIAVRLITRRKLSALIKFCSATRSTCLSFVRHSKMFQKAKFVVEASLSTFVTYHTDYLDDQNILLPHSYVSASSLHYLQFSKSVTHLLIILFSDWSVSVPTATIRSSPKTVCLGVYKQSPTLPKSLT